MYFKSSLPLFISQSYFCGQHEECMAHGSRWALQQAKSNIDQWFPVVAVLERMKDSLQVLDHFLPRFFARAPHVYEEIGGTALIKLPIALPLKAPSFFQSLTRIADQTTIKRRIFHLKPKIFWPPISSWNMTSITFLSRDFTCKWGRLQGEEEDKKVKCNLQNRPCWWVWKEKAVSRHLYLILLKWPWIKWSHQ